jgi:hypothetical protein
MIANELFAQYVLELTNGHPGASALVIALVGAGRVDVVKAIKQSGLGGAAIWDFYAKTCNGDTEKFAASMLLPHNQEK